MPCDPLETGTYITDGVSLYEIRDADVTRGLVYLENCQFPKGLVVFSVAELLEVPFRVVHATPVVIAA